MRNSIVYQLNQSVHTIWDSNIDEPFVKELANGTLPETKMINYYIQDSIFLQGYVKTCSLAIVKSKKFFEMKLFNSIIEGILNGEYTLRDTYLSSGDSALALASMLPCILSYYYIGQKLITNDPHCIDGKYGTIIRDYISEISLENGTMSSTYLEQLCTDLHPKERDQLFEVYRNASLYELKFWQMLYR